MCLCLLESSVEPVLPLTVHLARIEDGFGTVDADLRGPLLDQIFEDERRHHLDEGHV